MSVISVSGRSLSCWLKDGRRYRSEFGELPQVLHGSGEEEFVAGTVRPTQAQSAKLEDAFEMGE